MARALIHSKVFNCQGWIWPTTCGLRPWAQIGSILHHGTLNVGSFVRNQILKWKVNNSLVGPSAWEAQWKSLRGAFGVDPALSAKFKVGGAGSKHGPWNKWPGPARQLHHSLAALNSFHLLLQFTLYRSPLCSVDYSENYSNRHRCLWLPVKFRQRGAPAENTGIEKKQVEEFTPSPPSLVDHHVLIQGPHLLSGGFLISLSPSLGSGNRSLLSVFPT